MGTRGSPSRLELGGGKTSENNNNNKIKKYIYTMNLISSLKKQIMKEKVKKKHFCFCLLFLFSFSLFFIVVFGFLLNNKRDKKKKKRILQNFRLEVGCVCVTSGSFFRKNMRTFCTVCVYDSHM